MKKALCCALGLAMLSSASWAQEQTTELTVDQPGPSYLSAMLGYFGPDSERVKPGRSKLGLSATGIWGYQWYNNFGAELNLTGDSIRSGGHRLNATIDGYYGFGPHRSEGRFTPYILAGIGIASNNLVGRNNEESFIYNGGLGFVTRLSRSSAMRIRADARYIHDEVADGFDDYRISVGLEFPLFRARTVETIVERVEVTRPAPPPQEVPVEVPVPVEPDPCPTDRITQLRGVTFEFNSSRLQPNAINVLEGVYEMLNDCDKVDVEIAGHTDSIGSVQYNMKLSEERARAVVDWLVRRGLDRNRVTARGYGPHEPVANNDTDEGRELNRRVELRVTRMNGE